MTVCRSVSMVGYQNAPGIFLSVSDEKLKTSPKFFYPYKIIFNSHADYVPDCTLNEICWHGKFKEKFSS